jgi:hypothetical protein
MFAVDFENLYHGESSFIDLAKRQLMLNKITYPPSTLSRAFRYYKKGFSMCLGEMKTLIESIQEMPKEDKEEKERTPGEGEEERKSSGEFRGFFTGID